MPLFDVALIFYAMPDFYARVTPPLLSCYAIAAFSAPLLYADG
jgi:hypothetical protein